MGKLEKKVARQAEGLTGDMASALRLRAAASRQPLRRRGESQRLFASSWVADRREDVDALLRTRPRCTPERERELSMWLSKYQYCSKVFVLPPWKAIYENDDERDHTFEHAESVYGIVKEWYRRLDRYQVEVPKVSVAERCAYVLRELANSNA